MKLSSPSRKSGRVTSHRCISCRKLKTNKNTLWKHSQKRQHIANKTENNASSSKSKLCATWIIAALWNWKKCSSPTIPCISCSNYSKADSSTTRSKYDWVYFSKNIRSSSRRLNVSCEICWKGYVRCTAKESCIVIWNPRTFFCDLRTPWNASSPISGYPSSQTQSNFCLSDAAHLATWHPR